MKQKDEEYRKNDGILAMSRRNIENQRHNVAKIERKNAFIDEFFHENML